MPDITYCCYSECKNKACVRNLANAPFNTHLSLGNSPKCDYFKEYLAELARKERQEAIEEARREAMKLDDNEDTLKWKGTH